jgi:L-Ala-D/L-Glu epimerase
VTEHFDIQVAHAFKLSMHLKERFTIAYGSYDNVENIVVSLSDDTGTVGWGCAAPDEHVTGETVAGVLDTLRNKLAPALVEAHPAPFRILLGMLREIAPGSPAARAAVDIALYDLWSKHLGHPLVDALGAYRDRIPTSATIGILDSNATLDAARSLMERGFKILKVKCGKDPDEDIKRVRALKKEFGDSVVIRLDANQGYTVEQTIKVDKKLSGLIEMIEQPVDAKDLDGLARLAAELNAPVVADESVLNAADAAAAFEKGVPIVNVKLMKCGGINEALRICDVADMKGKKVMIGCMDEIPISMAAAAHLALAHPAVAYADLDGHLDLDQHIASSGINIEKGMVTVTLNPGLGVEVRKKYLRDSEIA